MAAMAVFIAVGAAAKSKAYRSVHLLHNATVAGSPLASGDYAVQWQENGSDATVSFLQGTKVVLTVAAKMVDRGTRYSADQVVYIEAAEGVHDIQEIRFKGLSKVITFHSGQQ
jgi:hypothetical protein